MESQLQQAITKFPSGTELISGKDNKIYTEKETINFMQISQVQAEQFP